MNEDIEYTSCKKKFINLLSYCEKLYSDRSNDYFIKIRIPILNNQGFEKIRYEEKINFKKFISDNTIEITNCEPFVELIQFLYTYKIFIKYLLNKKIIETEHILISDISDMLNDFVKNLLMNYLRTTNSLNYAEDHFSNLWLILNNFLKGDYIYHYYLIPLHGLTGHFSAIQVNDDIRIKLLTEEHYSVVSDLDIMTNIDKPDKRYWNLRYGIYVKMKEEKNITPTSTEIHKKIKIVLDSLRIFKGGDIYIGAIYPIFDQIWNIGTFSPRVGLENPPDKIIFYRLETNEIDDYLKLFKKLSSLNLESDSKRYISSAIRRFNTSYNDMFLEDKITNLTMVLEYLLTTGPGEIQNKLSLRGALLLGKDENDREYLWKIIKKFYDVRSEIVHGKKRKEIKINDKTYTDDQLLLELERITRQTLTYVIYLQDKYPLHVQLITTLEESIVNRNKVITIYDNNDTSNINYKKNV